MVVKGTGLSVCVCCVHSPSQTLRNIAEELDPTFQAMGRRADVRGTGHLTRPPGTGTSPDNGWTPSILSLPAGPGRQPPPDPLVQEPAFVPPTKRPSDKSGRTKAKEKKEKCKQQ